MSGYGIKVRVNSDFSINYEISDVDKANLVADFSKTFHNCRKMVDWFDNVTISSEQKLEYFMTLYKILESLHDIMKFMMAAGITEAEIIEQLQLPF